MLTDIGYGALLLATVLAAWGLLLALLGRRRPSSPLAASARRALYGCAGALALAAAMLLHALVTNDFRLEYVASYSSRDLALLYKVAAFHAGNAGSLLYLALALACLGTMAVAMNQRRHRSLMPYVVASILTTELFLLLLLVLLANPFARLPFAAANGRGLNPLLEHPAMAIHPPLMMAGFIGLSIPFAFALAALASRRLGDEWLDSVRRWTMVPWAILGVANLLGGWWAYAELGWGGYWGWDPVENAGIMPWLVATAFLHSVVVQKKLGMLKLWNMVLIILAYHLALFGLFLDRSGVLSSVHTFGASDLGRFVLGYIIASFVASMGLLLWRGKALRDEAGLRSSLSREGALLLNNLLLLVVLATTFFGTIYPWLYEAARGEKLTLTLGPEFFNRANGPILLGLLVLMGVGPVIPWRGARLPTVLRLLAVPLAVAALVAAALAAGGVRQAWALAGFGACGLVAGAVLWEWARGSWARHRSRGEGYPRALLALIASNRARYGGYVVHLSIVLMALGVVGSNFFKTEREATLRPGQSMTVEQYVLTYEGMARYPTPDKMVAMATVSLTEDGRYLGTVQAGRTLLRSMSQPVAEIAIRSTWREDLYIVPAMLSEDGETTFKVFVNPLVMWIWIGGGVFILGTLLALWPVRQEQPSRRRGQAGGAP
ncbi:MAG: heme lyase CcmF/NrfE family subunit [Dehalococcoidia bacterium]|nr:heme lyase CcmF/NrfE family subunit [Dehalococcoidia bacterium]